MAIKNLLVAYNGSASSDSALATALLMARKYDAHVTGLLAYGPSPVNEYVRAQIPDDLQEEIAAAAEQAYDQIEAQFHERIAAAGLDGRSDWIRVAHQPDNAVVEYARYADITLMGQFDETVGDERLILHPDTVALESGRPVLIVPRDGAPEQLGDRAFVAWDGKRAAARALSDAMQMLETKTLVTIITVGDVPGAEATPGMDVAEHLRRHGINTEWVRLDPSHGSAGRAIIDYSNEHNTGFLVMGAYEHSKLREDYFGGATKSALRSSKVPVLMSH